MAIHAGANIAMAVQNFRNRGYAALGGIILNRRNVKREEEKVQELAEDFETKLWFNGSAAVYGIARSKMEVMSSMVLNHGKIELPMVNMYELLKAQFEKENKS